MYILFRHLRSTQCGISSTTTTKTDWNKTRIKQPKIQERLPRRKNEKNEKSNHFVFDFTRVYSKGHVRVLLGLQIISKFGMHHFFGGLKTHTNYFLFLVWPNNLRHVAFNFSHRIFLFICLSNIAQYVHPFHTLFVK